MVAQDGMRLAFTGNTYLEHPISMFRDAAFLKLLEFTRSADVFFANLEGCIVDGREWPAYGSGMGWAGSYLGGPPWMVDELKFLGVGAVYAANNHVSDFGERGILSTMKHLRQARLPFAGIGANLTEASEACYISTGHGRVALIAAADWGPREKMDLPAPWPMGYMPSDEGPWFTSRPGVNLLRYESPLHVDGEAMDALRRISANLQWDKAKASRLAGGGQATQPMNMRSVDWENDTDDQFHFMGRRFVRDSTFGFSTIPYEEDLARLCKSVRDARRQADVVIVAVHDQVHGEEPHDYIRLASRACIDAGADVFVCMGGTPKGIEIYKGKPILHGQEGFAFQNSQVKHIPPSLLRRKGLDPAATSADFYAARAEGGSRGEKASGLQRIFRADDHVPIQVVVFDEDCRPTEVRRYPIQCTRTGTRRSVPLLLDPGSEGFNRVMDRSREHCARLGTDFHVRDTYGLVQLT